MVQRYKILVVDDEQVILDSAQRILDSERFHVFTALDAESAAPILESEAPDVLISDLMLPGASGIELLEVAVEQDPTLLTIITTGYSTVENAVASLKNGAFDFIPKPFTYNELVSSVHRACRAVELRLTLGTQVSTAGRGDDFHLGKQVWARVEEDGSALLGVTEFALRIIARIENIEFPEVDTEVRQGGRLVRLRTDDGMAHYVLSPLGGRVVVCNDRLRDDAEFLREDPRDTGWLVRILPTNPDEELANLIEP